MKVTLEVSDEYEQAVRRRIEQLQSKRARQLRNAGRDELAAEVEDADADAAQYMKELVRDDLADAGLVDE
ncbi:hypothetical protein NDI54_02120 [Haloarcula sp. S1AR25-5A]|uniref:Uncharacterized protein n=1 Tax=Haloarcula terrestris TaxID=2950533 RepID=A0AAE4EU48_9EURY|nr:hypothetical protein [Haloarcula terrestris]MDS0220140.1 hypothetical protein [Haloarcula terrestris]